MTSPDEDLRKRWLPNAQQMELADAMLESAGYNHTEHGVYTGHLLINKEYGWWTDKVELVFLDGVFLTREAVCDFVHTAAAKHFQKHGTKLTGGWAWHPRVGEAAVWEDIMSQFPDPHAEPAPPQSFLMWEDDLAVAFRLVADRAAAVKWLIENIDDRERFSATFCQLFADGTTWAEHVNPEHIEWLDECPDCGETERRAEGTECANCGHVFPETVTP